MKKRILSLALAFALSWSMVIISTPKAYATTNISATNIVSISKELAGKYPYVSGGSSPSHKGFDCTGLIYYIYHTRLGYDMTLEQARSKSKLLAMGTKITNKSELLPGDIIQYTASHVAIYVGDEKVLHAGTDRGVCYTTLENRNPKYNRVMSYAIRLPGIVQKDSGGSTTPITAPITTTVTITFDPNGGTVSPTTQQIVKGGDPRNLPTPTRSGYIFRGWALDKIDVNFTGTTSTSMVTEKSGYGFDKDTTIYALWEQEKQALVSHTHQKGDFLACEVIHPHRNFYICAICGDSFTDESTNYEGNCELCNPKPDKEKPVESVGHWGAWSDWSATPVSESGTRQVDKREVETAPAYTQYRYGGYVTSDGNHECWCETYLRTKFGSANLRYSDWGTTRYSTNGSSWTCGNCRGNHIHVGGYGKDGRPWWPEYTLPNGQNYYWEESRTVPAQYQTQYRYRDWITD